MNHIPDYGSVVEMLRAAARRAARRYHTEQEEMESVARFIYVRATRTYRPSRGSFERHLKFRLRRLADAARTEARRHRILPRDRGADLSHVAAKAAVATVMAELGPDAYRVAKLGLLSREGMGPTEVRRSLRRYLLDIEWPVRRIYNAFAEIRESVS